MNLYPYKFQPIYKEKIWGGRNFQRLYGRGLAEGKNVGESWELADLVEGTSVVSNGPDKGKTLTELTKNLGKKLLGKTKPLENGRFPLLLKILDANDILSLQVHPDAAAVEEIKAQGEDAALKTECWYVLDSRDGYIYKGVAPGVGPGEFRKAIESDTCRNVVVRYDVAVGDFHFLPAGTVHALGGGVVIAEVQTPSDTTYRVTDWGRGREIHVERSMQCIHFDGANDDSEKPPVGGEDPGEAGETLVATEFFTVIKRSLRADNSYDFTGGRCIAIMLVAGDGPVEICHDGSVEAVTAAGTGDTVLLPADLEGACIQTNHNCVWLEITLPDNRN